MLKDTFTFRETALRYRLFVPEGAGGMLPLTVYLPDGEEDNGAQTLLDGAFQSAHPCFVLIPEAAEMTPQTAQTLQRLIFDVRKRYGMDICRTYLIGCGLGAVGAWRLLGSYPRLFAGTIAVGGCGDPYHVRNAKYAPVWAFHARDDGRIHVSEPTRLGGREYLAGSRRLIAALRTEGSELARYTEAETGAQTLPAKVLGDRQALDWLFEQDRKNVLWVTCIRPGIYRLDDWFMASAYLIEGRKRALLIDTTMTHADLRAAVSALTPLPVDLAITHPHRDHMLHAFAFDRVYIHENDREAMRACMQGVFDMRDGKIPQRPMTQTCPAFADRLTDFKEVIGLHDGDLLDLGGVRVQMMELGGHTPNHVVFADHTHRCLFTGDAVGSGYVVGVRYRAGKFHETYAWYRDNLERFISRMKGREDYTCFGGHFIQENSCEDPMQEDYLSGQSTYFIPLTWDTIADMYALAGALARGDYDGVAHLDTGEEFFARYGCAMLAGRREG